MVKNSEIKIYAVSMEETENFYEINLETNKGNLQLLKLDKTRYADATKFIVNIGSYNKIPVNTKYLNDEEEPLSEETIVRMSDNKLFDTIDFLQEQVNITEDDIDEKDYFDSLLTSAIDEAEERFYNYRWEAERLDHILFGFLQQYDLYEQFEQFVEQIKKDQKDPEDTYKVNEEIYGDMEEFIRGRQYLKADFDKE